MRSRLIPLAGLALVFNAQLAHADYSCVLPLYCEMDATCNTGVVRSVDLTRTDEGWTFTEKGREETVTVSQHPDAGTFFANVFLTTRGHAEGLEVGQFSINRNGQVLYTVHALGKGQVSRTYIGSCKPLEKSEVEQ